jgi:ribose 5-phosphate isomerase A
VTDEGHYILDCAPHPEGAMTELAASLKAMPGVVEHGLFLTEADIVLLGRPDGGVDRLER